MALSRRVYFWLARSLVAGFLLSACGGSAGTAPSSSETVTAKATPPVTLAALIPVVAAENFYGDIVEQLGGKRVLVVSILSDPNIDPHEYEANVQTAKAISTARLVIENGLGYDSWMDKLLKASPNPDRIVVTAGDIADHKLPDNPHIWYSFDNLPAIAQAITAALKKLDRADAATFDSNLDTFTQSLTPLQQMLSDLKARYRNTPVGLTETIFLYQTNAIGLKVLTPFEFEKAIAEGNDPPADTVRTTNDQVTKKMIKILIYNSQTITPITTNLEKNAKKLGIPIVPVSETMPANKTYQKWMADQLVALEQALGK